MSSSIETNIHSKGFKTDLWAPEFGWMPEDNFTSEDPFPLQRETAFEIFQEFFCNGKFWVHLTAPMQAGKTGTINALLRMILSNRTTLGYRPSDMFVLTGMNDDAWKKQTKERVPSRYGVHVQHNGGLPKIDIELRRKRRDSYLKNILVIIDESHIASTTENRINRCVYSVIKEMCPTALWKENNIRFLTVSATDPAKVISIPPVDEKAGVIHLKVSSEYQSLEDIYGEKRIGWLENRGSLEDDPITYDNMLRLIKKRFATPRYHILRPKNYDFCLMYLSKLGHNVQPWHSTSSKTIEVVQDGETSSIYMDDINTLLSIEPSVHTFVVIKNMFYAAKTLNDKYVGVLYDRLSQKDGTILQSLLGRACGYGKSKTTVVITSKETFAHYISCWKKYKTITKEKISTGAMPGIKVKKENNKYLLSVSPSVAIPG